MYIVLIQFQLILSVQLYNILLDFLWSVKLLSSIFNYLILIYFFGVLSISSTEVEYMSSATDVNIPIPEGEDVSSSVNPFPCDFCSRRFNRKSHLMNHMVTHQSERPYSCALCAVRYRRKCDLANHMKIHLGPADDTSHSGTGSAYYSNLC